MLMAAAMWVMVALCPVPFAVWFSPPSEVVSVVPLARSCSKERFTLYALPLVRPLSVRSVVVSLTTVGTTLVKLPPPPGWSVVISMS